MSSSTSSEGRGPFYYTLWVCVVQGLLIVPPNLVVVLAILKYKALKREKEYVLILGQSLADAFNMMAYLTSGVYRLYIIHSDRQKELVPSRQCLNVPHVMLWSFADANAMLMLLFISVDRLVCTAYPLKYIKLKSSYAQKMVGSCYSFSILMAALSYYLSFTQDQAPVHSALCQVSMLFGSSSDFGRFYNTYYVINGPQVFMALSILLYSLVPPLYAYQKAKWGGHSDDQRTKIDRQRKINKTFAMACLCTLMVVLIPYRLAFLAWELGYPALSYALFTFTNLNTVFNLLIYRFRHVEVQIAVKGLLTGKTMPPVVRLWNTEHE